MLLFRINLKFNFLFIHSFLAAYILNVFLMGLQCHHHFNLEYILNVFPIKAGDKRKKLHLEPRYRTEPAGSDRPKIALYLSHQRVHASCVPSHFDLLMVVLPLAVPPSSSPVNTGMACRFVVTWRNFNNNLASSEY